MTNLQNENRVANNARQNPINPTIAAAIKQLSNRPVEGSILRRGVDALRILAQEITFIFIASKPIASHLHRPVITKDPIRPLLSFALEFRKHLIHRATQTLLRLL